MLDNINKLFTYFPDTDTLAISTSHDKYVGNNARYCVHVNKYKDIKDSVWGYVIVHPKEAKYICESVTNNDYDFSEEQARDILELAFTIDYNTGSVDGYNIKLRKGKREKDYELEVPELEYKRYWASGYFSKNEDEE